MQKRFVLSALSGLAVKSTHIILTREILTVNLNKIMTILEGRRGYLMRRKRVKQSVKSQVQGLV